MPLLLAALALAGLGISTYLTITHWGGTPIACAGVGDCEYVNSSPYATLGGVPVSALGGMLYAGLLLSALAWWLRPADDRLPIVYWGIALAGFGYAGYLTYVELYVLDAICPWCVTSASILAVSLILGTAAVLSDTGTSEDVSRPVPSRARATEAGTPRRR